MRPRCCCTAHVLLLLASSALALPGLSQSARAQQEVSPAVQQLYAEAKAAQASGDTQTAIAKYRAMIRQAPRLAPAYNNLGMLYFNSHDYERAIEALSEGVRIQPKMASAQAMLGESYFSQGEDAKAIGPLEAALRLNPEDDLARMTLGRAQMSSGRYADAAATLRMITTRDPKNQDAWYLLGRSYLQLSRDALEQVTRVAPESALAHIMTGEFDESMQNMDGAVVEYKRAVDQEPQRGDAHGHLANAYWMMGKWESAEQEFQRQLELDPGNCTAQWKLANAMLQNSQPYTDALPLLDRAVEHCPDLMQAHVDRARALLKAGRTADAQKDLEVALKAEPDEPSIHFLLAQVYRMQGNTEAAKKELEIYGRLQREASAAVAARAAEALKLKQNAQ